MSKGATEPWLTSRAIIGYVELVDCVRDSTSPWAEEDQYHWVLADPELLDEPVTDVPGQLKIWTFDPEKHRNFGLKHVAVQAEEEVRESAPRSYSSHPFTTTITRRSSGHGTSRSNPRKTDTPGSLAR